MEKIFPIHIHLASTTMIFTVYLNSRVCYILYLYVSKTSLFILHTVTIFPMEGLLVVQLTLTWKLQVPARTPASSACHWWGLELSGTCSLRRRKLSRKLLRNLSILRGDVPFSPYTHPNSNVICLNSGTLNAMHTVTNRNFS